MNRQDTTFHQLPVRAAAQSGATLVEVIVGIVIIMIALFALLRFFSTGSQFVERDGLRRQALGALQTELERIRAVNQDGTRSVAGYARDTTIMLTRSIRGEPVGIPVTQSTVIVPGLTDMDINCTYDSVRVALVINHFAIVDTLAMGIRLYVHQ